MHSLAVNYTLINMKGRTALALIDTCCYVLNNKMITS